MMDRRGLILLQIAWIFPYLTAHPIFNTTDTFQPPTTASNSNCTLDRQCLEQHFCHERSCHPCVPCEDSNREPSSDPNSCARTEDACGSCLKGFRAEEHINNGHSFKCHATLENKETNWTEGISGLQVLLIVLGLLFGLGVFSLVGFCCYYHRAKNTVPEEEKKDIENLGNNAQSQLATGTEPLLAPQN